MPVTLLLFTSLAAICTDLHCTLLFTDHTEAVNSVAFSPDGTNVVSASDDTFAYVWDVTTGNVVHTLAHADWVYDAQFFPDATRIVTATFDANNVLVWDVASSTVAVTLSGHTKGVHKVRVTPDGAYVASVSYDEQLILWDVAKEAIKWQQPLGFIPLTLDITPDGASVMVGGSKTVVLYQTSDGAESHRFAPFLDSVYGAAFSADGAFLTVTSGIFIGTYDTTLYAQTERALASTTLYGVAPNSDGTIVSAGGGDGNVAIVKGTLVSLFSGHTEMVKVVAMHGKYVVASASHDLTVRVWLVPPPPTPAPATPFPNTTAPDTDAPMTSAPLTKAPATDAPQTSAPDTDVPATMQPTTETPKETDVPNVPTTAPTPQPTLAESQVPTAVPWLGAAEADKEVVSLSREEAVATAATATSASMAGGAVASSVVAGGAAALPSSGLSRVSRAMVYLQMLDCPRQGMKEVPLIMSPSQLRLGRDVMREERGAAVGNMFVVLSLGLLLAAGAAVHERVTRNGSFITSLNMMPMPVFFLVLEMLWTPTMQSTTALLLHGDTAVDMAIASVVTGSCVGVLLWIWWLTWRAKQRLATVSVKPKRFLDKFVGARQKWVVRSTGRHLEVGAQDTGMLVCARCVFDGYCCAHCEYLAVQLIFTGAVGALSGWNPGDIVTCSGRAGLLTCMPLIWAAVLLKDKPFTRSVENWAEVLLSLLEFVFAVVGFLGVTQERRDLLDAGMSLSEWIGHAALMKFLLQLLMYFRDRYNDKQDYGAYAPTEATKSAADGGHHTFKRCTAASSDADCDEANDAQLSLAQVTSCIEDTMQEFTRTDRELLATRRHLQLLRRSNAKPTHV